MARAVAGGAGARRGARGPARAQAQRGPGAVGVGQWGGAAASLAVLLAAAGPAGASGVTSGEAFGKALAKDDPRKAYIQVRAGPSPHPDARTDAGAVAVPTLPAGPSGTELTALSLCR